MNDWYIDRSKNILNISFEPVIRYLYGYNGGRDSGSIISALIRDDVFDKDAGNLNAALTRFRDHGIINNDNYLGEPAIDYVENRITKDELLLDLLIKRPAKKKASSNLKPLVLLCRIFDIMFDISADAENVYVTYDECLNYLYPINNTFDVSVELVDDIISNRGLATLKPMSSNEIINISIWANALRHTPLFIPTDDKSVLRPNIYAKSLIKYISIYGNRISETPTQSNAKLYGYYCNRNTGITEIIPDPFKGNIVFGSDEDKKIVFDYLFGIRKKPDYNYNVFFEKECFGIYNSFMFVPGLAIRKVWIDNKSLGNDFFSLLKK